MDCLTPPCSTESTSSKQHPTETKNQHTEFLKSSKWIAHEEIAHESQVIAFCRSPSKWSKWKVTGQILFSTPVRVWDGLHALSTTSLSTSKFKSSWGCSPLYRFCDHTLLYTQFSFSNSSQRCSTGRKNACKQRYAFNRHFDSSSSYLR